MDYGAIGKKKCNNCIEETITHSVLGTKYLSQSNLHKSVVRLRVAGEGGINISQLSYPRLA